MSLCTMLWVAGCGVESDAGAANSSGGSEGPETFLAAPARGISILEVEINQGTRVPIGVGGDWVDESERLAKLVASRDSLLRVHYTIDEGWVPREIEARLTLDFPDGSSKSLSDRRMIERDSDPQEFESPFYFELAADDGDTVGGTRYYIELWETQPGGEALSEGAWSNPAAGSQAIGFDAVPMQIKTLLVPITYQDVTANLDEATTQQLIDNLYEQNPTTEILYDVHDPVVYDGQLIDLANLLPFLAQLRASENAEPNVYYHALVDIGSSSIGGLQGISGIANDTQGDAGNRVSATVLWSPNPSAAAETYTHETGHAQGLAHVACPSEEAAATDGGYPHPEGRIGNWGYGVRRLALFDPDETYDYMSYCGPSWVSDWTWNKTYERIRTLTEWDSAGAVGSSGRVLVVAVSADGRRQWWTMPGTIDPARVDGRERIAFETASGELVEADADVSVLSDGRTRWLEVALPDDLLVSELEVTGVAPAEAPRPSTWRPNWKRHVSLR